MYKRQCPSCHRNSAVRRKRRVRISQRKTFAHWLQRIGRSRYDLSLIHISVRAATGTTSAELELEVVVTGSYQMELTTPRGLLSTDAVSYTHLDVYKRQSEYYAEICTVFDITSQETD